VPTKPCIKLGIIDHREGHDHVAAGGGGTAADALVHQHIDNAKDNRNYEAPVHQ
jgi:hypothetical protein